MERQNKESDILKAAEQEFFEKGYAGAKTTSIAARAGVTHAMLHYYFRTKNNLFERIFDEKQKLLFQTVSATFIKSGKPLLERLEETIDAHFELLRKNPQLPRFLVNEILSNPERTALFKEKATSAILKYLPGIQTELDILSEQKIISKISAHELFLTIISLNMSVFILSPLFQDAIYGERTADDFFDNRKKETIRTIISRLKYNADEN